MLAGFLFQAALIAEAAHVVWLRRTDKIKLRLEQDSGWWRVMVVVLGVPPLLTKQLQIELDQAVPHSPPEGGQWNGPLVAKWIAQRIGRKVHRQVGWAYLQKLDYTLQLPRPHHAQGDAQAQAEFKKNYPSK